MTPGLMLGTPRLYAVPGAKPVCCACRTIQPAEALEVFLTPDGPRIRCADEAACRERFRPRRLAWSVRGAA